MKPCSPLLPDWIWLASKSPRRKELIESLGVEARVFLFKTGREAEELEAPFAQEDPLVYVERVTRLKMQEALKALAGSVEEQTSQGIVLTADTTVAKGGQILGKPESVDEALAMLRALSDSSHHVHTAVAVAVWMGREAHALTLGDLNRDQTAIMTTVQSSEVNFGPIPESFMKRYIESGEPFDKAGGYGIQGSAGQFVHHISGSHSGIMGLPLYETGLLLEKARAQLATSNQRKE